ncbi:RNA 2',3'-cyclic phosphodiesterase [Pontibacillus litoralis]|uniref:RNA 2',3'-cyclic phosphodiesterase n=1 Tax=Pontibacillus litoralis JSM 072002 TaxID=1385512 RepID=A0A0A5I034_9BACI|nr:RNA 2',3'-cyclic phosphodiesterase [Pontibacillus litoralis]KGX89217.1 hypothetical protein N784_02245 [Pontibacillus litoralis JSM 072002]
MSNPHYFIGISVTDSIAEHLGQWQQQLHKHVDYKVWTNHQDFHITLTFLGEVSENNIKKLRDVLKKCDSFPPFSISVEGLYTFGNPQQPRVLWAGVEKHSTLLQLQQCVQAKCAQLAFQIEKRNYTPHITLAKKWKGTDKLTISLADALNSCHAGELIITGFSIYRIHPDRASKYEVVDTISLQL